jgi:O-antigen/teichoic acid export membrane protein
LLNKILNTFGTKAISAVINLAIAIVLSQFLGPEGKGIQSLIITTITFVLVFANLVGGGTLVYLVPRYAPSLLLIPSYAWTLLIALISFFILKLFPVVDGSFVIHICVLSVLNSISAINTSILIGKEKISTANFIGLIQPIILLISLFTLFRMLGHPQVLDYLFSLYISFGLSAVVSLVYFSKYCGKIRIYKILEYKKIIIEMVHFGILNQVAHITQMLSFRLSFYVLDRYNGEAAVGIYSNGISIAESIWLISKSISLVQYARIANTDNRKDAAILTARLIKFSVVASLVLLIPLMLLPAGFYAWIFGPGFEQTPLVIRTLGFGVLVYNFSILIGHYFSGTGRYRVNAISSTLGLVASIILYFTLIPAFGIAGAGWATSLSYLITTMILLIIFNRENKGWWKELIPSGRDWQQIKSVFNK